MLQVSCSFVFARALCHEALSNSETKEPRIFEVTQLKLLKDSMVCFSLIMIFQYLVNFLFFIRFRDLERTSVPQATAEALEDVQLQTLANLVTPTEVVKKQSTLMHMLTLDCDKEALPTFPSWALTHLGTSTIYSHSSGVNQPGFLNGKFC